MDEEEVGGDHFLEEDHGWSGVVGRVVVKGGEVGEGLVHAFGCIWGLEVDVPCCEAEGFQGCGMSGDVGSGS